MCAVGRNKRWQENKQEVMMTKNEDLNSCQK